MKDKDVLFNTLSNINQWIFNCDTKVSIILAIFGIVFSIFFSSDYIKPIINIIKGCLCELVLYKLVFLITLGIILIIILIGIWRLIRVLIPEINLDKKSAMFFGGITTYKSLDEYVNTVSNYNENDIVEDLINQIYAAACICSVKFKNQKQGLLTLVFGFILFIVWISIAYIVFY